MTLITLNTLQTVTNEKLTEFYNEQITTGTNRELLGDILNEASQRNLTLSGEGNPWPLR